MNNKQLSERERQALINKFERPSSRKSSKERNMEMYKQQTDRNYKDGDRN
ncbi:MAG: hypothetical protein K6G28_03520 [Acholeplasmatales bacterium]|jgi:hypothetical protein|nr:hypothetical protein [Acholeplasmatales bacterium]